MAYLQDIDDRFVGTLALLIKEGLFDDTASTYRNGWLTGYAKAYEQLTGKTIYQLVSAANKMIEGSGKKLSL